MSEELNPKEEWLKEYSKEETRYKYNFNFGLFCKWANTNDMELVEEYKNSDPREFSKKWGKKIIQYHNYILESGKKSNTARSLTIAPRAFFKSQCIEVKIKRGGIRKAEMATGEHEFRLEELQKMYQVGNIEDKARLATAVNLGWGSGDFVRLEWKEIEPYLAEDLEPPVAFWHTRQKTQAPCRSHLTHEAIEALRLWRDLSPKKRYIFQGSTGKHLDGRTMNDWIKSLAKRAMINARGHIRFHLVRKFLLSQLSASGMNTWEAKLCVGKTVESSVLTYLKDLTQAIREKFMNAEPRFTLSGTTNHKYNRDEQIDRELEEMRDAFKLLTQLIIKVAKQEGYLSVKAHIQKDARLRELLKDYIIED